MSVHQTRSARRKIRLRYRGPKNHVDVREAIAREKLKAIREANMKRSKK